MTIVNHYTSYILSTACKQTDIRLRKAGRVVFLCYWWAGILPGYHHMLTHWPLGEWNFKWVICKLVLLFGCWGIFCAIILRWTSLNLTDDKSALAQVMAWCLFGTKPLPEPMLAYCQLNSWEQISMKFESEFYHFQENAFENVVCKNGGHFVQREVSYCISCKFPLMHRDALDDARQHCIEAFEFCISSISAFNAIQYSEYYVRQLVQGLHRNYIRQSAFHCPLQILTHWDLNKMAEIMQMTFCNAKLKENYCRNLWTSPITATFCTLFRWKQNEISGEF